VTPTKIVVFTQVMAARDTVTFEGSEEEMKILLAGAFLHSRTSRDCDDLANQVLNITKGNALLVTASVGMFCGGVLGGKTRLRLCMLGAIGIDDQELIESFLAIEDKPDCQSKFKEFESCLDYYYKTKDKKEAKEFILNYLSESVS
jgi:hypothetical protein